MALDKYANIATITLTLTAANTLSFQELTTQLGIQGDRSVLAMLIDQIDYFPSAAALKEMTATADQISMALTVSNAPTNLGDITDKRILHSMVYLRNDMNTAVGAVIQQTPMTHQFFPPMIMAEKKIYLGAVTVGLATAAQIQARIYYRTVNITPAEMVELVEVFRLVG